MNATMRFRANQRKNPGLARPWVGGWGTRLVRTWYRGRWIIPRCWLPE